MRSSSPASTTSTRTTRSSQPRACARSSARPPRWRSTPRNSTAATPIPSTSGTSRERTASTSTGTSRSASRSTESSPDRGSEGCRPSKRSRAQEVRMAEQPYEINLDVKFDQLERIDVGAEAAAVEPWFNQTLTQVNDAVVRLGVVEVEFHWHKHEAEDEFFLVLEGELYIDVEGADTVVLGPNQGVTIPRGVVHRPRAPGRTVIVMVEPATVVPTGND